MNSHRSTIRANSVSDVVWGWCKPRRPLSSRRNRAPNRNPVRPSVERLETIQLLSLASGSAEIFGTSSTPIGLTPSQIRTAYGFNSIGSFDGTGKTIAILDPFHDPNVTSDLSHFDARYGLSNPAVSIVDEHGGNSYPITDPGGGIETALDVEWAHAIAPGANILLVEFNATAGSTPGSFNTSYTDIQTALNTAASVSSTVAVSMSFGLLEEAAQTGFNSWFTTPVSHQGIVYLASTGDSGQGAMWPSSSPNVVAVGGTTLSLSGTGGYGSETVWNDTSGSGNGGASSYQPKPGYQNGVQSSAFRTVPDVSYNAGAGVSIYNTLSNASTPWDSIGGTSAGAPQLAGLVALIAQSRSAVPLTALDSLNSSQFLEALYHQPVSNLHDITMGTNFGGKTAGPGYDLATGVGTPVVNNLLPTATMTYPTPPTGDNLIAIYGGTGRLPRRGLSFQTPGTSIYNNIVYDATDQTFYDAQSTGTFTTDSSGTTFPIINYLAIPLGYAGNNNIPVAAYQNSSSDPIHFVIYDGTTQNFIDAAKTGTAATVYTTVQVGYAGTNDIPVAAYQSGTTLHFALFDRAHENFVDAAKPVTGATAYTVVQVGYAGTADIPVAAYLSGTTLHFALFDSASRNFVDAAKTGTAATVYTVVQVGYSGDTNIPVTSFINGSGNLVVILYDATAGMFTDVENTPAGAVYKSDYVR